MARRGLLLVLLALLALPLLSQTKYALVIGLGKQEDRAWPKINGDKDVPRVRQMLRKGGYDKIISLVNERATKRNILSAFNTLVRKGPSWRHLLYPLFWPRTASGRSASRRT